MKPLDWLRELNRRVFFYPTPEGVLNLLNARINLERERDGLVFDTASLAVDFISALEFCPINSGLKIREPARRGPSTFTRIDNLSYAEWRKLRGKQDSVREITLPGGIKRQGRHFVEKLSKTEFLRRFQTLES